MSILGNRRTRRLAIEAAPQAGASWTRGAVTIPITPPPPGPDAATEPLRRQPADDRPLGQIAVTPHAVFTPATPTPPTMPMRALRGPAAIPAAQHRVQERAPEDQALLQKVLDSLRRIDARDRAAEFAADKQDLAIFRSVVRRRGFCGLHATHRSSHVRWTTERWARQDQAVIEAQVARARAENHAQIDRALAEVYGKRRAA